MRTNKYYKQKFIPVPINKKEKKQEGRLVWNSDINGTYIKAIHGPLK